METKLRSELSNLGVVLNPDLTFEVTSEIVTFHAVELPNIEVEEGIFQDVYDIERLTGPLTPEEIETHIKPVLRRLKGGSFRNVKLIWKSKI